MKKNPARNSAARSGVLALAVAAFGGLATWNAHSQPIQWGLTVANINNPIAPVIVTNVDGSLEITAGGGDTYGSPDSFTYAYQQVSGNFDISVQLVNVTATDVFGQDTPKGALMYRASLAPTAYNIQISGTPPSPSHRNGQIESIGRMVLANDTDDLPGKMQNYGGDTTIEDYCTYPDVWLRIQRQGDKVITYFRSTNPTDFPAGYQSNPGSTNGWQILTVAYVGTNFPSPAYIGLSTVAHNSDIADTGHTVTATYANYGTTPTPPSNPTESGVAVDPANAPGAFPNQKVLAANFEASLPADGQGYPADVVQSAQGGAAPIIWNSGGFGSVSRDIIASISGQTPGAFSFARYQAGAFDFLLNPRDPVAAVENLGPYTNPLRQRIASGGTATPAAQAWMPSPNYGFVFATVRKNGQQWNDGSPYFHAAAYVQLDGVGSARGYDMIGGHFRGGQFYTRTTKLVTGTPTDPASDLNNLQRCAVPISVAWFPYDQGWKAGYFDVPDQNVPGLAHWKRGDGWGLNSGTALSGSVVRSGGINNAATNILNWVDTTGGGTYSGLATLNLHGVNSTNDGMLFTIGNDEKDGKRGPSANNAALPDGSGWYVAVRDIETSKADPTIYASGNGSDAGQSFSFVYVPYDSVNLIGGHIRTNGTTLRGAGNYTLTRLSTGRYALTIPGKTGNDGALLLQNSGYLATQPNGLTNVVDTSVLSYEYGGTNTPANAFIIESRYVDANDVATLRDADFNFVFVDFLNPLAPPGSNPPVLTIARSGGNVVLSWTNGTGYILQQTTALTANPVWTDIGPTNPSAPIPAGTGAMYFRLRKQQ